MRSWLNAGGFVTSETASLEDEMLGRVRKMIITGINILYTAGYGDSRRQSLQRGLRQHTGDWLRRTCDAGQPLEPAAGLEIQLLVIQPERR